MYHHVKKLMYTVRVDAPDPAFGNMLLEQFGGANGELAAAMQYSIQGLNCDDLERKDLLMDIGTEELSHLEVVGVLTRLHLKPMKFNREDAEADPLIAIAGGGGVNLYNSMGNAWTADYLKVTGELDVDLRSNIAAEARAKIVYERLINFTDDAGTKDALQFLMTREITHMKAFTAALESLGKPRFSIGKIPPTPILVDQFFNDSTGIGDEGEIDARGPWNEGGEWTFVEAPAFQDIRQASQSGEGIDDRRTSVTSEPEMVRELLVDQLRDLLHAEGQLLKALPTMASASSSDLLQMAFQKHLAETEDHAARLKECLEQLGAADTKAKPCKGMAGLIEEGQEVIDEGEEMDDVAADLALIASAQKVEHYEISGYGTARTLAGQIGQPAIAQILMKTLAEEEVADNLLTQIARELMGGLRTGAGTTAAEDAGVIMERDSKTTRNRTAGDDDDVSGGPQSKPSRSRSTTKR
ncbi:MAG: non-heme manganese-containing catalase [Acidobacteria bacterium]|nr:non-heme manganese-containing catalase [Acidobacteriota bacterium]